MILAFLLLGFASADAPDALRIEVMNAAADVSTARAEGLKRREIGALMARYRDLAEQLAALAPPQSGDPREAVSQLADATARGAAAPEARERISVWLGPPDARLRTLEAGLAAAREVGSPMKEALLADIRHQGEAMRLMASYDIARSAQKLKLLGSRLAATTDLGPGQDAGLRGDFEAERLRLEMTQAEASMARNRAIVVAIDALLTPLETP